MKHRLAHLCGAGALTLCLAAMAGATTAGATPPKGLQKATFRVTVDGVQKTTWKTDHPGSGGCDGAVTGNGTEKVRFTSRPVIVRATTLAGLSAPVFTAPGRFIEPKLRLLGTVLRQGVLDAAPGGECGGVGGGSIPRDCGTRSFRGVGFPLSYRLLAKPKDQLDFRPEFVDDPFANCPSGGSSFPTLVRTNEGREMRTELPRRELFDRSLGKIIVIAGGRESETAAEHTYLTTIRWVLTFERLGRGKSR